MAAVNGKRWIGGGLLAGLVINIVGVIGEAAVRGPMMAMFERLGVPEPGEPAMLAHALGGFVVGLVAVWIYAAASERYGAGTGTALRTSAAVWILTCLIPTTGLLAFGIVTPSFYGAAILNDLIAIPLATLAGARVYRDTVRADGAVPAHAARVHA